jgi:hypothetical protein
MIDVPLMHAVLKAVPMNAAAPAQSLNLDFRQVEGLAAAEAGSGTPPSAPPALFATPWQAVEAPALGSQRAGLCECHASHNGCAMRVKLTSGDHRSVLRGVIWPPNWAGSGAKKRASVASIGVLTSNKMPPTASLHGLATIDDHGVPDHEGGRVRTQPDDGRGDLLGLSHPADRLLRDHPFPPLGSAAR